VHVSDNNSGPWESKFPGGETEVMPVKDPHTRIKPLAFASGHGRCPVPVHVNVNAQVLAATPEQTETCVRWGMAVACDHLYIRTDLTCYDVYNRYTFLTVSLPRRCVEL
jgi:hypothetical protein